MKHLRYTALILLTGASLLTRAQSSVDNQLHQADNPLYRHIPANAEKVYQLNYNSLAGKMDLKTILGLIPQSAIGKNKEYIDIFSNLALAGIDTRQDIFIAQSNILNPDSPRYTTILLPLADSGKFIRIIKEKNMSADFVILPGKNRTAREGTGIGLAWNATLAVITFIKPPTAAPPTPSQKKPATTAQPATGHRNALLAIRNSLAALKGFDNSSFVTDPFFRKGFADDADFHTWSRLAAGAGLTTTIMQLLHTPMDPSYLKTLQKLKHNNVQTLGTLRFDNGRATFRSTVRYDSLADLGLTPRPLDPSLIERLPRGNLLGMLAVHLDPASYLSRMEKWENGKSVHTLDSILSKKGLTTKDILTAFKGDLLVAVIDSGKISAPASDSTPAKPGKPNIYIVLTINDMAAFTRVNNILRLSQDSAAGTSAATDTSSTASPLGKWHPAHTVRDNTLVLGPNQQATDDYFTKTGRGPSRLVTEEVRSNPFAIAIDVKALAIFFEPVLSASPKTKQMLTILNLFDQITYTGGKMEGKEMKSLFEIRMTDQQQNSLTTLTQLLQSMGKGGQK